MIHKQSGTLYSLEELEVQLLPLPSSTDTKEFECAGKQPSNNHWFNELTPSAKKKMAVEMLAHIPKREKPSAQGGPLGTRAPAIKVLYGLVGHFGHSLAAEICLEAGWTNEYWSPENEMQYISDPQCGIGVVIKAARENGWEGGGRYASLDEQIERYFGRSASKR